MYYKRIKEFEKEIRRICTEIFKVYGFELQLRLEEYNLLSNEHNCIESSTAIGFIIEEFLSSKLETYTSSGDMYQIKRVEGSTTNTSCDCTSFINNNLFAMVNIKAAKVKGQNNGVAAIHQLYYDYVENKPEIEKCFLIIKIIYDFVVSKKDNQRKIFVEKIDSYFLEEVDFSKEHKQDSRNWSKNYNPNSGRLLVSDKFRKDNKVDISNISYKNTIQMLKAIIERNRRK